MAETTETTAPDPAYKETEDGRFLVPLKLAHPLAKVFAQRARVEEPRDYKVGETVWVTRDYGNALIDAGMVQVDPLDGKDRQTKLLLNRRNMPLVGQELAKVTGQGPEGDGEGEGSDGTADATTSARANEVPKVGGRGRSGS